MRSFALVVVSLALASAVVELVLRLAGVSHPVLFQADAMTGIAHIPGAEGWYTNEGRGYIRINSDGWRDGERELAKPSGVKRVAVLGDSYVEALQVAQRDAFYSVLERELNARSQDRYEVMNFGMSGSGTGQQLLILQHRVLKYAPDIVLLAFMTGNDVSDNVHALKKVDYVPYFRLEQDRLVLDKSYLTSAEYEARSSQGVRLFTAVSTRFRTFQLVNHVRSNLRAATRRHDRREAVDWEQGLDNRIYVDPPADGVWREAWRLTERLLLAIREECRERGIQFYLVTLSNGVQVHPDPSKRRALAATLKVADLFQPDHRLKSLGDKAGFAVLNLAPHLAEHATNSQVYYHGFGKNLGRGHWNEQGHLAAGKLIAEWLLDRLRSESKRRSQA